MRRPRNHRSVLLRTDFFRALFFPSYFFASNKCDPHLHFGEAFGRLPQAPSVKSLPRRRRGQMRTTAAERREAQQHEKKHNNNNKQKQKQK